MTRRLETLLQDLRYTFRTLRKDAAFTTFAILIVGLGIGASTTLFSVVDTLLLRPLPFRDPERLAWITNYQTGGLSGATTQVGIMQDLREQNKSFSDIAGYFAFYGVGDNVLSGKGEPERLSGVPVSENFFPLLGVAPQIGRQFNHDECKWNGPKAVMISHGLWVRRFASDPGIVGRTLTLDNQPVPVVGVMPATFDFTSIFVPASHIDLYFPFPLSAETNRWGNTMAMVGRLKPGVTTAQAQAEVKTLGAQINNQHLAGRNDFEGWVMPLKEHVSGGVRLALIVLSCGVGAVMLIVCANLSNLLLARMAARQKEIAIRTALGAGRWRLVRQMLTEGVTLSSCGAILGVALAWAGTTALAHLDAVSIPLLQMVRMDGAALACTLGIALLTGVIFGLAPAFHTPGAAMHDALKDSGRGSTEGKGHSWIRSALVVSEIAFACVLLVGAGLLTRSFVHVLDVQMGFQPERAMSVRVDPVRRGSAAQQVAYFNEVLRLARAVPGVQTAGLTDALPLGRNRSWGAPAKGVVYRPGEFPDAFVRIVSDGYVGSMGIPLRAGRDLSERDTQATEPVIVVNETMARRLWPGQEALGKIMSACGDRRVVGIVSDVRHLALEEEAGNEMYIPIRQCGDWASLDLVVRTTRPPEEIAGGVTAALKEIAPNLSPKEFRPLQRLVDKSVSPRRFVVTLLGGFAVFALVLASLGIYAVISYSVNQRTQEIGIRMALGASSGDVQSAIIVQTLGLAAMGMVIGAGASWMLARLLRGMLFGVTATDPATFIGMLAALTVVAAIAGYVPAYRASRIDPAVALRAN